MKTNDLINSLSKNLSPAREADSLLRFFLKGFFVLSLITIVSVILLPIRSDFTDQIRDTGFAIETFFWVLTSLLAAITAYRHSIPGLNTRLMSFFTVISALGVLLTIPWGSTYMSGTAADEFNIMRGLCGGFISLMSGAAAVLFFFWSRKLAPTKYWMTGFWIVLSTSSFGSAVMQLICSHDSAFHLYLWHVLPTTALAFVGAVIGTKTLKW